MREWSYWVKNCNLLEWKNLCLGFNLGFLNNYVYVVVYICNLGVLDDFLGSSFVGEVLCK